MPTKTVEQLSTIQKRAQTGIPALLMRIQSEYHEMPGLVLTEAQAKRLWDLDQNTCDVLLSTLTKRGFLKRTPAGTYVRAA